MISKSRVATAGVFLAAFVLVSSTLFAQAPTRSGRRPAASSAPTGTARAVPVYEQQLAELVRELNGSRQDARAIVPLLAIFRMWNDVDPASVEAILDRTAADTRANPYVRSYAAQLAARGLLRSGRVEDSRARFRALGYITSFRAIGPFDNEGKAGLAEAFGPERDQDRIVVDSERYDGKERAVGWRTFPDVSEYGYVSFDALFRPDTNVCAYAETFVELDQAQRLQLWLGAGGASRLFWNGSEVLSDTAYRQPDPDRFGVEVSGRAGTNRLLVKACASTATWGFFLRIVDAAGRPLPNLRVSPTTTSWQPAATAAAEHRRLDSIFDRLQAAGSAADARPEALITLAKFLSFTGADDPAEERAKQLARRAADANPTVENLLYAATLETARGDVLRLLDRAETLAPRDPRVIVARARARLTSVVTSSLSLLDGVPDASVAGMDAVILRADFLNQHGFSESARTAVERASRNAQHSIRWLALRATYAEAAGDVREAYRLRGQLLQSRFDDQGARRTLLHDALTRGDGDSARRLLDDYRNLGRDSTQARYVVGESLEALNDLDGALAAYRSALELAPEDANAHVVLARALLRTEHPDEAARELEVALTLRPQDSSARELLEDVQQQGTTTEATTAVAHDDEGYAVPAAELLARAEHVDAGYPLHTLEDLTVNTVFANGLGSSFRQVAVKVNTDEGTRDMRSYSIPYDPSAQRVELRAARVYRNGRTLTSFQTQEQQMGEPWYRIYYDTRAFIVIFPDLEVGDVVEILYRVDDAAAQNRMGDYYGDVQYFQQGRPVTRVDYWLRTPTARSFYLHEPGAPIRKEESTVGDQHLWHFFADNLPAIRREEHAPGATEISPYLHVSTYANWNDVGRWWWGLVQDQLYADESLRATVQSLVRDAPNNRVKVERIYNWVVRNTRYVGLEFGIHGFLPYRVPQIVQRGFGDCKDKASLIYTMLREAGVDARIVLVRTNTGGAIDPAPASLAVFNHAIAYVPEFDLYLDGTAEFSGVTEFPSMDQGTTVLVVGPNTAELRTSPVMTPQQNATTRTLEATLSTDGSAELAVEEIVTGPSAPAFRSTYQAEGTRRERLERHLRGGAPGLNVVSLTMHDLDNFEAPVRFEYRAHAPQFGAADADGLRIPLTTLGDLQRRFGNTRTREYPLIVGTPQLYRETRTVVLPRGYSTPTLPGARNIESPFGTLRVTVERPSAERVVISTEFSLRVRRVEARDYPSFRAFLEQIEDATRQRLVLLRPS